jgi:hypothetical protein
VDLEDAGGFAGAQFGVFGGPVVAHDLTVASGS